MREEQCALEAHLVLTALRRGGKGGDVGSDQKPGVAHRLDGRTLFSGRCRTHSPAQLSRLWEAIK